MLQMMKRALKSKPLLYIVGLALAFILIAIALQVISDSWNSDDYLFAARWSIDELQSYFTGALPADATAIVYQPGPATGLLTFTASPETATEFANRFCGGLRYQGYDPFNAQDKVSQSAGY